jgi:hypothetical protein
MVEQGSLAHHHGGEGLIHKGTPMNILRLAAPALVAIAAVAGAPVTAQTTAETKVSNDTNVKDGVVTHTRKVEQTSKRKTRQPKKVLGVKVGHKTAKTKVVRETTTDSAGNAKTKVSTSH